MTVHLHARGRVLCGATGPDVACVTRVAETATCVPCLRAAEDDARGRLAPESVTRLSACALRVVEARLAEALDLATLSDELARAIEAAGIPRDEPDALAARILRTVGLRPACDAGVSGTATARHALAGEIAGRLVERLVAGVREEATRAP